MSSCSGLVTPRRYKSAQVRIYPSTDVLITARSRTPRYYTELPDTNTNTVATPRMCRYILARHLMSGSPNIKPDSCDAIQTEIQEFKGDNADRGVQERLVMPRINNHNRNKETKGTENYSNQNVSHRKLSSRDLAHRDLVEKCRTWIQGLPDKFSGLNTVISVPNDT